MSKIEDILYEAHDLGLYNKVMKEVIKMGEKNPHMEAGDRYEEALRNVIKKTKKKKVMKKIWELGYGRYKEIWEEYLTIKGGDFLNWKEGLSPIEEYVFKELFERKQNGYFIK